MYAPHTVTLYNVITETHLETFVDTENVYITILRGVFLDASKAVNVRTSGLESADAVNLFIPFSVTAVDSLGNAKTYASPQEFLAAQDRSTLWTLAVEGDGGECFFVKGEVVTTAMAARAHDDSYKVTKVDMKDFGSVQMRHFEVGGA